MCLCVNEIERHIGIEIERGRGSEHVKLLRIILRICIHENHSVIVYLPMWHKEK